MNNLQVLKKICTYVLVLSISSTILQAGDNKKDKGYHNAQNILTNIYKKTGDKLKNKFQKNEMSYKVSEDAKKYLDKQNIKQIITNAKNDIKNKVTMNKSQVTESLIISNWSSESTFTKNLTFKQLVYKNNFTIENYQTDKTITERTLKEKLYGGSYICPSPFSTIALLKIKNGEKERKATIITESYNEIAGEIVTYIPTIKEKEDDIVKMDVSIYCGWVKNDVENYYEWQSAQCNALREPNKNSLSDAEKILLKNDYYSALKVSFNKNEKQESFLTLEAPTPNFCKIQEKNEVSYYSTKCKGTLEGFGDQEITPENCCIGKNSTIKIHSALVGPRVYCTDIGNLDLIQNDIVIEEPSYTPAFKVSCQGITYTGFVEQFAIDVLENFRETITETLKPYTTCCQKRDVMYDYSLVYANMMCLPDLMTAFVTGKYKNIKISQGISSMVTQCTHHLSSQEIKAGGMFNTAILNAGVRLKQDLSAGIEFAGCLGKKIAETDLYKQYNQCLDQRIMEFYEIVEEVLSFKMTVDLGMDMFKVQQCKTILDDPSTLELNLDPEKALGGENPFSYDYSSEKKSTGTSFDFEDGKSLLGVIKNEDYYLPGIQIQEQMAFWDTNCRGDVKTKGDCKSEPLYLYDLLTKNISEDNRVVEKDFLAPNACYENSAKKAIEFVKANISSAGFAQEVNGLVYLYLNNVLKTTSEEFIDIGLFDKTCRTPQKRIITKAFEKSLETYINEYLIHLQEYSSDLKSSEYKKYKKEKYIDAQSEYVSKKVELNQQFYALKEEYAILTFEGYKEINQEKKQEIMTKRTTVEEKITKIKEELQKMEEEFKNNALQTIQSNNEDIKKRGEELSKMSKAKDAPAAAIYEELEVYQYMYNDKQSSDYEEYKLLKEVYGGGL